IFRLVTRSSPYSSLPDAFSSCPSFFFSAFDSRVTGPLTVTLWPTCWSSLTLLRRPQVLPSSLVRENSPASSPFCKQPVTVSVWLPGLGLFLFWGVFFFLLFCCGKRG